MVVIDPPERSSQSDHPAGFMEKPLSVLGNTCRMLHMDHVAEMASALNRGGGGGDAGGASSIGSEGRRWSHSSFMGL